MKFENLFQDPLSDSDAPYAESVVLDAGGLDARYGGETIAHVSFQDVDPFEIMYHAMPDDWEPHKEYDGTNVLYVSPEEVVENSIHQMLNYLGTLKGWQRS